MNALRGGRTCSCACAYEYSGGSSSGANRDANYGLGGYGGYSTYGCNTYWNDNNTYLQCPSCSAEGV